MSRQMPVSRERERTQPTDRLQPPDLKVSLCTGGIVCLCTGGMVCLCTGRMVCLCTGRMVCLCTGLRVFFSNLFICRKATTRTFSYIIVR